MFTPIKQTKVVEEVYRQIAEHVLLGEMSSGARLPSERELATQFAVSRSTIREAVRKLEQAGLVSVRAGAAGGVFVAHASTVPVTNALSLMLQREQVSAHELMETRRFLESATARLAALRATPADLQRILESLDPDANLSSKSMFIATNAVFHEAIAEAAHNKVLLMSVRAIRDLIEQSIDVLNIDHAMMTSSLAFHRRVYEAIRDRDPGAADEAIAQHLDSFERKLAGMSGGSKRGAPPE